MQPADPGADAAWRVKVLESAKVVDTNGVAVDLSELDSEMAALTGSA